MIKGMTTLYSQLIKTIMTGIKKFADVVPNIDHYFVKEFTNSDKPERPFFTYHIYDDYTRTTFKQYKNEPWLMSVQFKSHADDDLVAKDMAFSLLKLLNSQQLQYDLAQVGIGVMTPTGMPPLNESFTTRIEFMAGVDVQFLINDDYTDPTQTGQITDADLNIITKKEGND